MIAQYMYAGRRNSSGIFIPLQSMGVIETTRDVVRGCFDRLTGTDVPWDLPGRIHILCNQN